MKTIANILWFLTVGLACGLLWYCGGLILCLTIIGIPLGLQYFKMAKLNFLPFGKRVVIKGGAVSTLVNVLWIVLFGWELALTYLVLGLVLYCTIIGIPCGNQCMKMLQLSLFPFGAEVHDEDEKTATSN